MYTTSSVWDIMENGTDDLDELIDVQTGLMTLPVKQRVYIVLLSQGYTSTAALKKAGITATRDKAQGTKLKQGALERVARRIN